MSGTPLSPVSAWSETETLHRDGKQQLGRGDCRVRSSEGQTRHPCLVSVAYTLLMASLHQHHPQDWARRPQTTSGEACWAAPAEPLEQVVDWMVDKLTVDHTGQFPELRWASADFPLGLRSRAHFTLGMIAIIIHKIIFLQHSLNLYIPKICKFSSDHWFSRYIIFMTILLYKV